MNLIREKGWDMATSTVRALRLGASGMVLALVCAGCGSSASSQQASPGSGAHTLSIYTSVTADTVGAVKQAYSQAHPDTTVRVFRAPTGKMNARIAADERSGGVRADVIWATDPLSMHSYVEQHLLKRWQLPGVRGIPEEYKTDYFWGTRLLQLVLVTSADLQPQPEGFADLTESTYRGEVALPDPSFAGSAFVALGYLAQREGMGYFRKLKANGATQVSGIPQVVTDVARGRYQVGVTLARTARKAVRKGSPVRLVWPQPGAIALYSPIGITRNTTALPQAKSFVRYVLSRTGQRIISQTGWTPVRRGVEPPFGPPATSGRVSPDWQQLFTSQRRLLKRYQSIF
jgi:iron(III) transport system substrate-binding protein